MSKDTISYDINFLELTLQVWAEIRKDVQFVELEQESELLSMAGRLALQAAKESCGNAKEFSAHALARESYSKSSKKSTTIISHISVIKSPDVE